MSADATTIRHHRKLWMAGAGAFGFALAAFASWLVVRKHEPATQAEQPRPTPTFSRDVAPIVFSKCAPCHHPGEAAPFSLLTLEDLRGRARQIVDVTQRRLMPPWLPAPEHGDFAGARRLSNDELQTLRDWVDSGLPAGDPDALLPAPQFPDHWQAARPDLVLETPEYTLNSQGRDVFRNFVVPVPFDEPRWIQSIELRPTNPRVTHHARLGIDNTNESVRRDAEDEAPGYAGMAWGQDPDGQLVIWAPGMSGPPDLRGAAWRLYPRSVLVLHAHLQPSGKPETTRFQIGIRFARQQPELHPAILRIGTCNIDIPAGERRHVVNDSYVLPIDVDLHTIFPHAHSLCRELHVAAIRPNGDKESLISIQRFDENWHDAYRYRQPVRLPRGTRLVSTFVYDNSEDNVRNRQRPPRRVVYGSNVTDEMADVYLQVTAVPADRRAVLLEDYRRYESRARVIGSQKALELRPEDPWNQETLATALIGIGEPKAAQAVLERRVKTGPPAVYPIVSLGMALLMVGNAQAAEEKQRQAIAMDGQYPLAWFALGRALIAQKKTGEAEPALRRAAELAPGFVDSHLLLADLLIQRGQLEAARDICTKARHESPDSSPVCMKLAEIAAKRFDYNECLSCCQAARRLAPYTHPPKVLLAVFCFANGDQTRGEKLLEEASEESPLHPMPPLALGQLARRRQQGPLAREYLTAAAALPVPENWPESHKRRFLVLLHSERFQLAQFLGDQNLGRDALSQWLKLEPGNPELQKLLKSATATP